MSDLPEISVKIMEVIEFLKSKSQWAASTLNAGIESLEKCEAQIAGGLVFLSEQKAIYQYLHDTAKDNYEIKVGDEFRKATGPGITDGVAKNESKRNSMEMKQKVTAAKYRYEVLNVVCKSQKDVLSSLTHRIKTKQNEIRTGQPF